MKYRRSPLLAALAAAFTLSFAATAPQAADDMRAQQKDRIEADSKAAREACGRLSGNARDICTAEARGKEKIALAELEAGREGGGGMGGKSKVAEARAEAAYEVAKEKCDDRAGNDKDVCMKDAKAAHTRAKADAQAARTSADARREAAGDKREAGYEAARERCDGMSGNAKDNCVNAAKARYGK